MVARARSGTKAMTQVSGSWGYWMDGICDAIGTLFFFAACWLLLQKRHVMARRSSGSGSNGCSKNGLGSSSNSGSEEQLVLSRSASSENLFSIEEGLPFLESSSSSNGGNPSVASRLFRLSTVTIGALLAQQFFSSLFWNRYMQGFHQLLEVPVPAAPKAAEAFQVGYHLIKLLRHVRQKTFFFAEALLKRFIGSPLISKKCIYFLNHGIHNLLFFTCRLRP